MGVLVVGNYIVRRPFDFDGRRMVPGETVDVTGWRNGWQLVDRGYLVEIPRHLLRSKGNSVVTEPNPIKTVVNSVTEEISTITDDLGVSDSPKCSKCGVEGENPCLSKTGKPTLRHSNRI
jgi:hypothetical protein